MPPKFVPQRVFRIHRRADGKYETRNECATDSPMGVDRSLSQAIGTAQREATLASAKGCRVQIELEQFPGSWKCLEVVDPPRRPLSKMDSV